MDETLSRGTCLSRTSYKLLASGRRLGFLNPLEDADPDIPALKQAKAEYAKLR